MNNLWRSLDSWAFDPSSDRISKELSTVSVGNCQFIYTGRGTAVKSSLNLGVLRLLGHEFGGIDMHTMV